MSSPGRSRLISLWVVVATFAAAVGPACRSKQTAPASPSARASASAAPASSVGAGPSARCRPVSRGEGLVVGNASGPPRAPDDDEDDDEPELPFATSLGSATTLAEGFAVGGISAADGGTQAFVAFVPLDGGPGHTVALGAVHGDPDPPVVAREGDSVLAAVENSDASGAVVELVRIRPRGDKAERGPEISEVGTGGFGLAVGDKSSVVVWSARKSAKAALRSASIGRAAPGALGSPNDVPGTSDAESPVLRARPGGFWLAWISQRAAADAGAPAKDASAEETPPLAAGPRVLSVALLDAEGKPSGAARAVSGEGSHVVAFDAATLADGALALAWREDDAAPGVETGGPELARVGADGAVQRGRAADEALGAGAPSLVTESGAAGPVWLLVPGEDDRARMALLAPSAVATSAFVGDDSLRGAEILAALPGKRCKRNECAAFLLARGKNRAVELGVVECDRIRP